MSLINQLKSVYEPRWQALQSREKRLVGSGLLLAVVVVLYYGLWLPLQNGIAERQTAVAAQQQLLDWTRQATGSYLARVAAGAGGSTGAGGSAGAGGSITQRITDLAAASNVTVTRLQPQSSGMVVVIDQVGFNQLLDLLEALRRAGLSIDSLDVAEGGSDGVVRVRKLQVSGA